MRSIAPERIGRPIESPADLTTWIAEQPTAELHEPFTFVIDLEQRMRVAARRSEHVACAGGQRVLGAGEIAFEHGGNRWTGSALPIPQTSPIRRPPTTVRNAQN